MVSGPQKSAISNGRKSSSADRHRYMSGGQRTESLAFIRSAATKSGRCESCSGSFRTQSTSLPLSAEVHGCGYALANAGHDTRAIQDWLGHRSIQHTVRYTELAPTRFKDFWRQ